MTSRYLSTMPARTRVIADQSWCGFRFIDLADDEKRLHYCFLVKPCHANVTHFLVNCRNQMA
jgi:hypothetical protein